MKFIDSLWKNPLGTVLYACNYIKKINWIPGIKKLTSGFERSLFAFQFFLDSSFDRKYGTDTSGRILLKDLTIIGKNIGYGTWYGAMSPKLFKQIMHHLKVNFKEFQFIDFGSGKGRVLLMASAYGFNKIIGVEFARELHRIANNNISVHECRYTKKPTKIENIFEDATNYIIPDCPLIIFFNSPFIGNVMELVLKNISSSFVKNPRKIFLIFYGQNPQSIELFKAINFQCKEIQIDNDWTRFLQLQCFLFTSPEV